MRKYFSKKGFTIVELMVAVAIMGIIAAVAVPTYTSFMNNSKDKTCSSNIETIKATASSYYSAHGQTGVPSLDALRGYMADDVIPACPWAEVALEGEHKGEAVAADAYKIYVQLDGSVKVVCPFNNPDGSVEGLNHKHNPAEAEAINWSVTGTLLA